MSPDSEPSLLEYARRHGLAHNHRATNPLANPGHMDDNRFFEDLPDDFPLDDFNARLSRESLSFGKDAMSVLASVRETGSSLDGEWGGVDVDVDVRRWRKLKQELPLVRTDPELDMVEFRRGMVPDLKNEVLPMEAIDEEADEGFTWPSKYHGLIDEFAKSFESETLAVSSQALLYLRDALRLSSEIEKHEWNDDEGTENDFRMQNTARDPVTPPLLPLSPPFLPFIPSSDTGHLDLLSDHSSPTHQQAVEVNRLLNDQDAIVPQKRKREAASEGSDPVTYDIADVEDFYSPLRGVCETPSSPPTERKSLQDRKVEGPLTPLPFEPHLPSKSRKISSREALLEIIPDLPPLIAKNEDISSDDVEAFFAEVIAPIGIKAARSIEQEQLQAADTELRVPVPIMDFSRPLVPWKSFGGSHSYKNMLSEIKRTHLSKHAWPAVGKTERELRWNPIPATEGRFEPQETIADDGSTAEFLEQPECIDGETLIWKPEGLRILDDLAESEEELEVGKFPDATDLNSLVRRRILELEADSEENFEIEAKHFTAASAKTADVGMVQDVAKFSPQVGTIASLQRQPEKSNSATESLSVLDPLERFMFTRKGESQTPKLAGKKFPAELQKGPCRNISQDELAVTSSESVVQKLSDMVPQFIVPSTPHPFVVSTSFLNNRKLARRVQQLHPAAEFIERDFNLHSSVKRRTGLEKQSADLLADTMTDEADMILSPSTGLILTTLQKIKQRSLPGQTARSAVREAISRAAPRYERLLVLVSGVSNGDSLVESTNEASPELNESDCEALVEFMGFCSNVRQDTQVLFVAAGEEQLAHWIVAMMVKHGVSDPELKLLQEETLWEIFLRRAGMNAFAAQAILAELRAPDSDSEQDPVDFGLTGFVKMDLAERVARFEGILGGRGVLTRVSKTLDARW
ncbi:hypothetical protein MMC29_000922 [Sticta canariensis]|nr:hypothetical protein [Sticta canariensis]